MESAQDQTLMDVKELRTQHIATRRKLERLERDVVEVCTIALGSYKAVCGLSKIACDIAVQKRTRRNG